MTSSKNDWKETKFKIKEKFSKLSNSDVESLNGHMDLLVGKVQKTYEYDQTKAEQVCKIFSDSLKKH